MTGRFSQHVPLKPHARLSLLALAGLAGCAGNPQRSSQPGQATLAACGQRADAIVEKQNRGYYMTPNTQGSSPYSSTGLPSNPVPDLVRTKERDDLMNQCVNGSTANTGATPRTP